MRVAWSWRVRKDGLFYLSTDRRSMNKRSILIYALSGDGVLYTGALVHEWIARRHACRSRQACSVRPTRRGAQAPHQARRRAAGRADGRRAGAVHREGGRSGHDQRDRRTGRGGQGHVLSLLHVQERHAGGAAGQVLAGLPGPYRSGGERLCARRRRGAAARLDACGGRSLFRRLCAA
ncbi:hypothetical protein D3C71_1213700 [compost metagenome]